MVMRLHLLLLHLDNLHTTTTTRYEYRYELCTVLLHVRVGDLI